MVRLATLIQIAGRYVPFFSNCLTRSLLLCWILRRRGIPNRLCIGVRLKLGILDAHAWVEYAGIPINETQDVSERFVPFAEIASPGPIQLS